LANTDSHLEIHTADIDHRYFNLNFEISDVAHLVALQEAIKSKCFAQKPKDKKAILMIDDAFVFKHKIDIN